MTASLCPVHEINARTAYSKRRCRCDVCVAQRRADSRRWYANGASEQQRQWREANKDRVTVRQTAYYRRTAVQRREKARAYYREHADEVKARVAEWRAEHCDHVTAYMREYARRNRDVLREAVRSWRRENRERHNANNRAAYQRNIEHSRWQSRVTEQRRRAKKQGADGHATEEQVRARMQVYGERCYLCGDPYEAIDHVIPLARGGSHWPANLRPICTTCNSRKGARLLCELAD
jgi:5-methylcytosine-specific restriction endonuclease McrA